MVLVRYCALLYCHSFTYIVLFVSSLLIMCNTHLFEWTKEVFGLPCKTHNKRHTGLRQEHIICNYVFPRSVPPVFLRQKHL